MSAPHPTASHPDPSSGTARGRAGRVVIVGSLNLDLVVRTPRMPLPGETLVGSAYDEVPGGKGGNQAVAAARLGAQVSMVGALGSDGNGTRLRSSLEADGIDCSAVSSHPTLPSGVALIMVEDSGQNAILIVAGSNGALTPSDILRHEALIRAADVVVCQLETPLETVRTALDVARRAGRTTILNPAPATGPLPRNLLDLADYLIPNEVEAALITGESVDGPAGAEAAARKLQHAGARHVLVTLGRQGALLVPSANGPAEHFAGRVVKAIDTTAAGDTFVGGFAAALARGEAADAAIRFGQAAAALSVTRAGAQTSIPHRHEVTA